ncbi:hypothetical protein [Bacillus sp. FJAT-49711]|nr:hypothetical protein [Bacillus sp. FJAT-49711]
MVIPVRTDPILVRTQFISVQALSIPVHLSSMDSKTTSTLLTPS